MKEIFKFSLLLLLWVFNNSCNKLVEIEAPVTSVNLENVYKEDATAIAVLTAVYISMSSAGSSFSGSQGISLMAGLSADEWRLFNQVTDIRLVTYSQNKLSLNASIGHEYWRSLYQLIFVCNSAIEGLNASNALTFSVKQQLLGEAAFLRAFFYFYLINLFGDVPLVLTTDYTINSGLAKSSKSDVYKQIIDDLRNAQNLLSDTYLDGSLKKYNGTSERLRPSKWAATALLARVFLYTEDWMNAEIEATKVIDNSLFSLSALDQVYLKDSKEAIWQLQPVEIGRNTEDARIFVINGPPGNSKPVYLSQSLLNAFESGDKRRTSWVKDTTIGSVFCPYAYKYKKAGLNEPVSEYLMIIRLGELFLIRSESRSEQNNISGAKMDLNFIRTRAGLANITTNDRDSLVSAILQERKVELFSEWGHRWLDLKRTNLLDNVMNVETPLKGGVWQNYQKLYPIPLSDIERNPNIEQNENY